MIPAEEQAERRAALRALLARPLLVADTGTSERRLARHASKSVNRSPWTRM